MAERGSRATAVARRQLWRTVGRDYWDTTAGKFSVALTAINLIVAVSSKFSWTLVLIPLLALVIAHFFAHYELRRSYAELELELQGRKRRNRDLLRQLTEMEKAEAQRKMLGPGADIALALMQKGHPDEATKKAVALQLATELRDIRHKVEIVKSTRPAAHYSHGFRLPAFRWDELDDKLARWPDLYASVEKAYTAAHHVNEALEMRRTRAGRPDQTLGVIPDDGLDEAYEAAGDALDALGEPRGEVWESGAVRAVRLVAQDIAREFETDE